jgi:hypothetical protein
VTPIVSPHAAKVLPGSLQTARVHDREPAICGSAILAAISDFGTFTKLEIHQVGYPRSQNSGPSKWWPAPLRAIVADSFKRLTLNT